MYVRNLPADSFPRWIPGVITKPAGPLSFLVALTDGRSFRRHIDHIRKRHPSDEIIPEDEPLASVPSASDPTPESSTPSIASTPTSSDSSATLTPTSSIDSSPITDSPASSPRYPPRARGHPHRIVSATDSSAITDSPTSSPPLPRYPSRPRGPPNRFAPYISYP